VETFARDWIEIACGRLGLGLKAEIAHRRDDLRVTLTGDARGFGNRKPVQIASALQTLLQAALVRQGYRDAVDVQMAADVGSETEAQGMTAAVRAAAVNAASRGRAFALGPMSWTDRRQIHQALNDVPQVWTQSEGDGIFRRLWVVPRSQVAGRAETPSTPTQTTEGS
jgi:predicted RNA-binding protein Jag